MSQKIKEPKEKTLVQSGLDELMLKKISEKETKWNNDKLNNDKLMKTLFNFTDKKLINQVIWIKSVEPSIITSDNKELNETDLYNHQIFKFEILNRKENTWSNKKAILPNYLHTRLVNLDYQKSDIFSVKYLGLRKKSDLPDESYHKFFVEKLE